jgi:hypothetical protein
MLAPVEPPICAGIRLPQERSFADMTVPTSTHRPGAISAFFVYKAGLFGACFWGWLGFLTVRGGAMTGWHLVAAAGAVTTTLVGVALGVRFAMQRDAAARHAEIMEALVDISWHSFTSGGEPRTSQDARTTGEQREDAGVIRLPQDLRQRPRR